MSGRGRGGGLGLKGWVVGEVLGDCEADEAGAGAEFDAVLGEGVRRGIF